MNLFKRFVPLIFFILIVFNFIIWFILPLLTQGSFIKESDKLVVSMLDVGQGDAIYIKAPNGKEMLIDGGPDNKLLQEVGREMSFFDRKIDIIMITNPDKDHIGGFIPLLKKYDISFVVEPGTFSKTETYRVLEEKIKDEKSELITARFGQEIILDEERGIKFVTLFPDRDVSTFSTNDGSIVGKLVYGDFSIMFQGDAPKKTENILLKKYNHTDLDADILKVGHHGSYTSTDSSYVRAVSPSLALISCGRENRYGHPHKETLDTLARENIPVLRTDVNGRISIVTDGIKWELEKGFWQKIKEGSMLINKNPSIKSD